MRQIEFNIRFITPLLIHGAESREADSIGLTGKALRGCWRFWFRAMVGGMVKDISKDKEKLLELESMIFGSSDENVGAKFRTVIEPLSTLTPVNDIYPGFNKGFNFRGFPQGCEFNIRILPRNNMTPDELNVLLATIWLWGNLGGIGQRARRGFGSPVIKMVNNTNLFSSLKLSITPLFKKSQDVENYIKSELLNIWKIFETWLSKNDCSVSGNLETNPEPTNASYFILHSLKQVAVCTKLYYPLEDAIKAIHGNHTCDELGWVDIPPKSYRSHRHASPVFIRFHKVRDENKMRDEFLPIFTWCKQPSVPAGNYAVKYLRAIGFNI